MNAAMRRFCQQKCACVAKRNRALPSVFLLAILLLLLCLVSSSSFVWHKPSKILSQLQQSLVNDFDKLIFPSTFRSMNLVSESDSNFGSSSNNFAYATYFSSHSFLPALQAFLISFVTVKMDDFPLLICICADDSKSDIQNLAANEVKKYHKLNWRIITFKKLGVSEFVRSRWKLNWSKLFLWALTNYSKIFYVDLDVIFFRPVHFAFNATISKFLGTSDVGRYSAPDSSKMNGGVFMLEPDWKTLFELLKASQSPEMNHQVEAEQGLFNKYFVGHCCLPFEYNVQKTVERYWPTLWIPSKIRILHFVGEKPWNQWSTAQFREFHLDKKIVQSRIEDDSWDADLFLSSHKLWKSYYFTARKEELARLQFFIGYHSQKCWPLLDSTEQFLTHVVNVRLAGPIFQPSDADAHLVVPMLQNRRIQKHLGEFGTMLVASKLASAPFVGISSWKAPIKATWYEGVSIDWTKVHFEENTAYCWFGMYTDDYYQAQSHVHSRIWDVVQLILPHKLPPLAPDFYCFGQYVILSRRDLTRYVDSAMLLVKNFWKEYEEQLKQSTDFCPFEVGPTDSKSRCIGYILERYLNIWIKHSGLKMVYAADNSVIQNMVPKAEANF
jgi:lipopolysaccharide biosynthesis glycosyltransferase